MDTAEIRVRFITDYTSYRVDETPISVPSRIGRYGLSEIINHLRDLGTCGRCNHLDHIPVRLLQLHPHKP